MFYIVIRGILFFVGFFGFFQTEDQKFHQRIAQTVQNFGQNEAKNLELEFLGEASWKHVDAKYSKWTLSFIDRKPVKIIAGRKKIVNFLENFWHEIQTNTIYRDYVERHNQDLNLVPTHPLYNTSHVKLDENSMGIRLAYWDENNDRRTYPYLAQIRVADSKIYYYYANSQTQALGRPVVETFEEARQKVNERLDNSDG